jgi:predicted XRE-type DNA-binding protein
MLTIPELSKQILERLHDGKDLVVAITGDERDGKSSMAIHISREIDPLFDLERNILYSPKSDEMENKVRNLPKYAPIIADEAIKAMYKLKRDRMLTYINKLYMICGKENKLSILNIPRFTDLSEYFRRHRVRIWIWIIDPISLSKDVGHAAVFSRTWVQVAEDPWYFKDLQRTIDEYSRQRKIKEIDFNLNHRINVLSKSRNFVGIIEFGKMPEDLWVKYNELKDAHAYVDMKETDKDGISKWENRSMTLAQNLLDKGEYTQQQIADFMDISPPVLSKLLKKKKLQASEKQGFGLY